MLAEDPRTARHEATRARILAAAWELAKRDGLAALSLREVARRVGMRAPSLYTYFESKHAIYDAMFAEGATRFLEESRRLLRSDDATWLRHRLRMFMDFCTSDPVRFQLLFQRTIPGFEPSSESFAISVEGFEALVAELRRMGVDDPRFVDLWTALASGLASQQVSNDPGGHRWARLVDDAVDMYWSHVERRKGGKR